jgi:hypothetical protein
LFAPARLRASFSTRLCSIQDPLFTGLPRMMQNHRLWNSMR